MACTLLLLLGLVWSQRVLSFTVLSSMSPMSPMKKTTFFSSASSSPSSSPVVSCKITVRGDGVQGGYYRASIFNEASNFRSLVGTLTELEDGKTTELYVEGKKANIEGFIRWCGKSPGLAQKVESEAMTVEFCDKLEGSVLEKFIMKERNNSK